MLKLDPMPEVITFDSYGTLVQWHRAVRDAACAILSGHLQKDNKEGQAPVLADRLREVAVKRQQRQPFHDYKSVLHSSLDEVLAEAGHTATSDDQETLLSILRRIEPHPEVPAAFERLRARYRLAIISNTDDDLIAGTVAAIGAPIDFVITAQQARSPALSSCLLQHECDEGGDRSRRHGPIYRSEGLPRTRHSICVD